VLIRVVAWLELLKARELIVNQKVALSVHSALESIRAAIDAAPRNAYIAELHLQIIKYAEVLNETTGKEFCEGVGIGGAFATEFSKMRKIAKRLRDAGLDVNKI